MIPQSCETHKWFHTKFQCPACLESELAMAKEKLTETTALLVKEREKVRILKEALEEYAEAEEFHAKRRGDDIKSNARESSKTNRGFGEMKILDMSAGNRAIWFNKKHPDAIYLDKRREVNPDICMDITEAPWPKNLPYDFDLICWDPPHMNCGPRSNMSKVYGYHTTAEILNLISVGGFLAYDRSKEGALMALKWNTHDIKLKRVFDLLPNWEPLFGHLTKDGPGSQTYWIMLRRRA